MGFDAQKCYGDMWESEKRLRWKCTIINEEVGKTIEEKNLGVTGQQPITRKAYEYGH